MAFLRSWNGFWRRHPRPAQLTRPQLTRLTLERLEDRTVPAVYFVAPGGADAAGHGGAANPFASIQYALNRAAASGDTIEVAAGTYAYNAAADVSSASLGATAVAVVLNKQVTILGGYNAANWSQPPNATANPTILDGQGTHRGLLVLGTSTGAAAGVTLENVTIQNGLARGNPKQTGDGAIFGFGGGAFIDLGDQQDQPVVQTFRDVIFRNNVAMGENSTGAYGGGGVGGGLAVRYAATVVLDTVTFTGNQVRGGQGAVRGGAALGGGLDTDHTNVYSAGPVVFTSNVATGGSGAGGGQTSDGERADGLGGAAALQLQSSVNLDGVTATSNLALGGTSKNYGGGGYGGGFYVEGAGAEPGRRGVDGQHRPGRHRPQRRQRRRRRHRRDRGQHRPEPRQRHRQPRAAASAPTLTRAARSAAACTWSACRRRRRRPR